MKVILSAAMSADGYIDSADEMRLRLSSVEDFYDVHILRSECDAILVGAETVRKDNPSLITKHEELLKIRRNKGLKDDPVKITFSKSGNLPFDSKFFSKGNGEKWIFSEADINADKFGKNVRIFANAGLADNLRVMEENGIKTLLVEGGCSILTQFLQGGLVNHLRLAVAPFFVGAGVRFVGGGDFPNDVKNRMDLVAVRRLGDVVVMDYEFA